MGKLKYWDNIDVFASTAALQAACTAVEERRFDEFLVQFDLQPIEREALTERFEQGMSFKAIAEEHRLIGGPVYAKRIVDRALKKIKTHLETK